MGVGEERSSVRLQQPNNNRSNDARIRQDFNFESEATMVRLAMNALQGLQSSLVTIHDLSEAFRSDPADRTFHRIPTLWSRSSSTHSFGKILNSIACSGSSVFLLRKFVHYHQNPPYSLVNQAFAVAVGKVLEGYASSLDTLYASVGLRHSEDMAAAGGGGRGCLTSVVVHSEVTLLEVYLHTKELRTQIQALANICKLDNSSVSSFKDVIEKSTLEFRDFPRGGDLLSYLYTRLEFADHVHRALLKFLFLRSCEPYCRFIRSWIYEAKINDPYEEFIVEYAADNRRPYCDGNMHFPLATIREEQDGVVVPCFLRHYLIPLLRAGQQLQVLIKLRELCIFAADDRSYVEVLPCWSGFSSYHPIFASSLTFNKVKIEAMVTARSSFYTTMQKKLENILTKLEIRYQQVVQHDTAPVFVGTPNCPEGLISSSNRKQNSISAIGTLKSDASTSADEFYCVVDSLESCDYSSVSSSEEENGPEQLIENSSLAGLEHISLSVVSSSSSVCVNNLTQKPPRTNESNPPDALHEICGRIDPRGPLLHRNYNEGTYLSNISASLEAKKQNLSWMPGTLYADNYHNIGFSLGGFFKNHFHNDREYKNYIKIHPSKHIVKLRNQIMAVLKEGNSSATKNSLTDIAPDNDQLQHEIHASSSALNLQSWKLKYNSSFLSMNPMLTKHALFHLLNEPEETCRTEYRELFSCFDFSSVEDPFKICVKKLDPSSRPGFGVKLQHIPDSDASATTVGSGCNDKQGCDENETSIDKCEFIHVSSLNLKLQNISADISGGSGWESMLAGSGCVISDSVGDYTQSLAATMFDIPLDFIIDKCLLQEIMLQYKYVSKLTIKLLKEGFDLQDHLMALRRYHFMEVADWADLFITSLWHQKWYVTGADNRISEIQGLLELSVQRSSCERDHYKDRLFVFKKGQGIMPLSASAIGVHSFDFLGLGYRVDWPVSIVLTSVALEKYAEIFNFLIRVKIAVFALTDVWCSLKDLMHVISRNHNSELHKREVRQINFLMKMRHQANHFVITLQQYVLSQLSHVSWCKFLHSLKYMVKDMIDFESVHMVYLTESLQICFLSAETQSVARTIENILQCALDFQSCFIQGTWRVGPDQEDSSGLLSHINIYEVLAIKKRFDKELKDLYLCYLKSPKHGDLGLSRFWEYINFNEYYLNAISDEIGHFAFSV